MNDKNQPAEETGISPHKISFRFSLQLSVVVASVALAVLLCCNRRDWQDHVPWCSWKYIICNFSWVNIAGSLVKQRDELFWERKCCVCFVKAGKALPQLLESVRSVLDFRTMRAQSNSWASDGPCVVMPLFRQAVPGNRSYSTDLHGTVCIERHT